MSPRAALLRNMATAARPKQLRAALTERPRAAAAAAAKPNHQQQQPQAVQQRSQTVGRCRYRIAQDRSRVMPETVRRAAAEKSIHEETEMRGLQPSFMPQVFCKAR